RRHTRLVSDWSSDVCSSDLTEQARRTGAPAAGWADLVPELNQQPGDHMVTKRQWGAFRNTGLEEYLRNLGVTQVVIGGVSPSMGVEAPARQAQQCGFNVTLAGDAMTGWGLDA